MTRVELPLHSGDYTSECNDIDQATRLSLHHAVYPKGTWRSPDSPSRATAIGLRMVPGGGTRQHLDSSSAAAAAACVYMLVFTGVKVLVNVSFTWASSSRERDTYLGGRRRWS